MTTLREIIDQILAEQRRILNERFRPTPETEEQRRMRLTRHLIFGNGSDETRRECAILTNDELCNLLGERDDT